MLLPQFDLPQGTLIRIGAGVSAGIEGWLQGPDAPARVILIEPHPDLAKALATRLAGYPQVSVLAVAIGAVPGQGALTLFSNLAHGSLQAPLPLLFDLLPGLRAVGAVPVTVQTMAQVLDALGPLPQPVHLELDAPGAEADVLEGLRQSGHLDRIDVLDLRGGAEPLYTGQATADALRAAVQAAGFDLTLTVADDPDWPEYRLTVDRARREMERRLAELTAQQDVALTQLAHLRADAEARAHRIAELERAQDSTVTWGREQEWLAGERAARITELEQALDNTRAWGQSNEAQLHDRQARLQHVEAEVAALRHQAENDRARNAAQAQALAAKDAALGEVETALAAAKEVLDAKGKAKAEAEAALAEAVAAQTVALAAAAARASAEADLSSARAAKLAEAEAALASTRQTADARAKALREAETALADAVAARNALTTSRNAAEAKAKEQGDLAAARAAKLAEVEAELSKARSEAEAGAKALAEREAGLAETRAKLNAADAARNVQEAKAKEQGDLALATKVKLDDVKADLAGVRQDLEGMAKAVEDAKARMNAAAAARDVFEAKAKEQGDLAAARAVRLAEVEAALAKTKAEAEAGAKVLAERDAGLAEMMAKLNAASSARNAQEVKAKEQGDLAVARAAKLAEVEVVLTKARQDLEAAAAKAAEKDAVLAEAVSKLNAANAARNAEEAKAKEQGDLALARATKLAEVEAALSKTHQEVDEKAKFVTEKDALLTDALAKLHTASAVRDTMAARAKEQGDLAAARGAKLMDVEAALAAARQEIEARANAIEDAEARATAAASSRNEFEAKFQEQAELAAGRGARLAEVEAALTQARDRETAATEHERLTALEFRKQRQLLDDQVARAGQDVSTALRMQAVAVADLRSLQGKFGDLTTLKDAQEALLRQLTPQLQQAAAQFRGLIEIPAASTSLVGPLKVAKSKKAKKSAKRRKAK